MSQLFRLPGLTHLFQRSHFLRPLLLRSSFRQLMLSYDVARGFNHAQLVLLNRLPTLSPGESDRAAAEKGLKENVRTITQRIEGLRETFPEVVDTLETTSASRVILIQKRVLVDELFQEGLLDEGVCERIHHKLMGQLKALQHTPFHLRDENLSLRLRQFPQFKDLSADSMEELIRSVRLEFYDDGELIIREGDALPGFILILRGRVEVFAREGGAVSNMEVRGEGEFCCSPSDEQSGYFSCKAISPVELLVIPGHVYTEVASRRFD